MRDEGPQSSTRKLRGICRLRVQRALPTTLPSPSKGLRFRVFGLGLPGWAIIPCNLLKRPFVGSLRGVRGVIAHSGRL